MPCGPHAEARPSTQARYLERTINRMWAWIELSSGTGWGPTQALKARLADDGYHVDEFVGSGPSMLLITGSALDRRSLPSPPRAAAVSAPGQGPQAAGPCLRPAPPSGSPCAGTILPVDKAVTIKLADGTWIPAHVTQQCRDPQGRWCVHLRWGAGQQHDGWFVFDPALIRRTS